MKEIQRSTHRTISRTTYLLHHWVITKQDRKLGGSKYTLIASERPADAL